MNNPEPHLREPDPVVAQEPAAPAAVEPNLLALHGDPSLRREDPALDRAGDGRTIAWVRPSELPTMVGTPVLRRAMDAQSETVRRVRRAPARVSRSMIAEPQPAVPTRRDEGLSL